MKKMAFAQKRSAHRSRIDAGKIPLDKLLHGPDRAHDFRSLSQSMLRQ